MDKWTKRNFEIVYKICSYKQDDEFLSKRNPHMKLSTLIAAVSVAAVTATSAFAGSPAPTVVEPTVFEANEPSSMSPWASAGLVVACVSIAAAIADDDDTATTTAD